MSLSDRDGVIWLNGAMVPWREAKVHALSHTLHYGMGVFEGLRAYETATGPAIFRLQEHTDRLFRSAHIMGMDIPFNKKTLNDAQVAVMKDNNLKSAYIRPLVFYGAEGMSLDYADLSVNVMIASFPWDAYVDEASLAKGIRMCGSSYTRGGVNSVMSKAKASGNYINSILALREAKAAGYDEALMMDSQGFATEGSGQNLFIVRHGKIHTPDLTAVLEGITRDTAIKLARDMGYEVVERRITRDEVVIADEVFLTGSAAEILPVSELDGRIIGSGVRGPVTEKIQTRFFDVVRGKDNTYSEWLTPLA